MMKPYEPKPKSIQTKVEELQKELGTLLRTFRISRGIQSEFTVAKSLGFGYDTIHKIEKGLVLPRKRTLLDLKKVYELSNDQYKDVLKLVNDIKVLRNAIKESSIGRA